MIRTIRLMAVSAVALGLSACGGGAKLGGGKEGAAQAAFQASQSSGRGSTTGKALVDQALASGATTLTLSANCAKSGSVSLTLNADGNSSTGSHHGLINYTVVYNACNEDGENEYNGKIATSLGFGLDVDPGSIEAAFIVSMKGKLTIEGEVSDYIDTDVQLSMEFAATSLRTGSVRLVVDGTIKTSSQSYTYKNETITTRAGQLPKA